MTIGRPYIVTVFDGFLRHKINVTANNDRQAGILAARIAREMLELTTVDIVDIKSKNFFK